MSCHDWSRTFLPREAKKPPVEVWIKCTTCGAQVCETGWGKKRERWYRPTANHEWVAEEPPCSR